MGRHQDTSLRTCQSWYVRTADCAATHAAASGCPYFIVRATVAVGRMVSRASQLFGRKPRTATTKTPACIFMHARGGALCALMCPLTGMVPVSVWQAAPSEVGHAAHSPHVARGLLGPHAGKQGVEMHAHVSLSCYAVHTKSARMPCWGAGYSSVIICGQEWS